MLELQLQWQIDHQPEFSCNAAVAIAWEQHYQKPKDPFLPGLLIDYSKAVELQHWSELLVVDQLLQGSCNSGMAESLLQLIACNIRMKASPCLMNSCSCSNIKASPWLLTNCSPAVAIAA